MSVLYTKRKISEVLRVLRIKDSDGRVDADEAARILTWRVKEEQGITHIYTPNNIRRHKSKLDAIPATREDGTPNMRANLYCVEKLFALDVEPRRTNRGRAKVAAVEVEEK